MQLIPGVRELLVRESSISYRVSVPLMNLLFFTAVTFVYEGQPRYAFPVLFVLVFCLLEVLRWTVAARGNL